MRELTLQEKEEVGGGILPLIGFGLAVAGKVTAGGGVTGWAISSASLILGSYGLAHYFLGGKIRGNKISVSH